MKEQLLQRYGETMSTKQIAEVLHVSPGHIINSVSLGKFPISTFKTSTRRRVAYTADVADYLDKISHKKSA